MPFVGFRRTCVRAAALLFALTGCGGGGDGGPAPAARIDLSTTSVALTAIGATRTVTASVKDASGGVLASAPVTWSSDAPSIATVTAGGVSATITGVASGSTTIRATSGAATATVSVQVAGVRSVTVSPATTAIRVGDTQAFTATVAADAGISTAVTWTSTNPAVASISATGVVSGVSVGSTTVRATSVADPLFSTTAAVTVSAQRSVIVTPTTGSLVAGQTLPLAATVQIDAGLSTAVTWRTSAAALATVSATGVVTAVANGAAVITAVSVGDTLVRGSANITVLPSVRGVTVTPVTAAVFLGATQQITGTVFVDGAVSTALTWRSANPTTATVNATGLVTAIGLGTTTITAIATADTTKRATATVVVSSRPTTVAVVQRNVTVNPTTSTTLTGTVLADPGVSTAVTWNSSATNVATINSTGRLTGIASGTTLITATSVADASKRDTVTVTVVPTVANTWSPIRLSGPLYEDILSIVSFSPTSAFAVNFVGDVFVWTGTEWRQSLKGSSYSTQFSAVHGSGPNNVIAVGNNGVIARFDGSQWLAMQSGTTRALYGVFVEPSGNAFAVGANGTALRLNLSTWSSTATGTGEALNGVWSSNGVAIAVGTTGTALRFDGTSWSALAPPTSESLNAVSGTSPTDVIAVGSFGSILRFDGTSWGIIGNNGFGGDMWSIYTSTANAGRSYIASDDGLLQLDAGNLSGVATDQYLPRMFGVSVDQSGVVWVGGQRGVVDRNGLPGGKWETLNIAPDLLDIWSTSPTNSWAVGEFGFIYRWNGTAWTKQVTPTFNALNAVWAPSANEAFAGGDRGVMLRWNGTTWSAMPFPSLANISAIWGASPTNVFATTDAGEIVRYNGTAWTVAITTATPLWSVFGVSPTEVYAGGDGGSVQRFNGTTWTAMLSPANGTIAGLWMTGFNNIVAVGADGTGNNSLTFNFDGTSWQGIPLQGNRVLTNAWGTALTDIYVTGDLGALFRFNGSIWLTVPTATTDLLWSISAAPSATGAAFAVGYNSTILVGSGTGAPVMAALSSPASSTLEPSAAARRARAALRPGMAGYSGLRAGRSRVTSRLSAAARTQSTVVGGPRRERRGVR